MHNLIIVLFFLHAHHCSSVTVKLTGSANYALLDQTFRFTCAVTDEDDPTLGVLSFTRFGSASACSVIPSSCSQNGFPPGYSCGCVSGQRDVYYMNISSVSVQKDEGTWRCQRSSKASNNITLPVVYLKITSFILNSKTNLVTVNESDHLTMRCEVDSKPGSTIRLLKGSSELSRTDNSLIELNLTAACRQRGNYSCVATNDIYIGSISKSIHLAVKCSPSLDGTAKNKITAAVGDDATLSVTLLSYPEPSITWRKSSNTSLRNLTSISSVSRVSDISVTASLTLTGVQQQDFGEYFVQAVNGVGTPAIFTVNLVAKAGSPISAGLVGGAVAGVVIVVIIVVVVVVLLRNRRNKGDDKEHITRTTSVAGNRQVTNESESTDMPVYAVVEKGKKSTAEDNGQHSHHSNKAYQHENQPARNTEERSCPPVNALNYLEVEIVQNESNPSKPSVRLHQERTEYTKIQPGVRGPQPKDEDED